MKTIDNNRSRFSWILGLVICVLTWQTSVAQELHTPYPIIFVHGIVGNAYTFTSSDTYNIVDFLKAGNTPLQDGGILNITLDYDRNSDNINTRKEDDVHLFNNPKFGDFYVINFDVHATGTVLSDIPGWGILDWSRVTSIFTLFGDKIGVTIPSQFFKGDIVRIGDELMKVTDTDETSITLDRGKLGTTASLYTIGDRVWNLSWQSNQASIAKQGYGLKLAIDAIKAKTNANKVILVGHSMGGLAAREYIRKYSTNDVAKIVTIGTPHGGSNLGGLQKLIEDVSDIEINIKMIDGKSDASRDLKTGANDIKTILYGKLGVYLFGGKESSISDYYYSKDVDGDGAEVSSIIGLNSETANLENISKTWIVSSFKAFSLLYDFLLSDNDGVVLTEGQYLYEGDTIMAHRPHISIPGVSGESKDIYSLIRGLDEPKEPELAYEIGENSTNKGYITLQKDMVANDIDLFKIILDKDGKLSVNLLANNKSGIEQFEILDDQLGPKAFETNIANSIECDVTPGTYFIRITGKATSSTYEFPYTLNTKFVATPPAAMSVLPGSLQFYDVVMNAPKNKTITLTNNGTTDILITSIGLSDIDAEQFTVAPMPPFAVTPELSQNLTVSFNPTSIGAKVATIEITTNTPDIPKKTVSLKGNGTDHETKVLVSSQTIPYNFGNTKINTNRNKTITIQNTGSNACTVSEMAIEGLNPDQYTITSPSVVPFNIGSGETKQITVKFLPSAIGVKNAQLAITNNSDNLAPKYSIDLYGNGIENVYSGNGNIITLYEYWFDDNYAAKVTTKVDPGQTPYLIASLSTNGLYTGLHFFHLRYKDNKGKWSAIVSEAFHRLPPSASGKHVISGYEYWFDNDYISKVFQSMGPQQNYSMNSTIPVNSLINGLHSFHIRYQDDSKKWSSVVSEFFQKQGVTASPINQLTAYRYWFDMDNASMTTVNLTIPANPYQLIKDVSTSSLSFGNHSSHFQFKDTRQVWSSVLSSTFYKCSPSFALITASGSTSFCEGGSVTLTTNIGNTYLWNYGPTTKSITVSTSGDYIVTVTDGNGCSATSTATTVTVNPIPPTPTISSNGSTLTSTSPTGNQWYYSSNIIPNATSDTYVPSLYGNYYTIVTLNNCPSLPSNIVSHILTNIDDISSTEKIKVYPNPTTGLIEISIKEPLKSDFRIDVVNRLGSLLKTELKKKNIKSAQIDLSSYPSDLYLIIIHTESESYQFRVIKN